MNSKKQIAVGAVLSYVQIAVGAVITFLYTPFMMRALGQGEYGLYNTVSSVVSSLSLLSLGFGSCYVKFYSVYRKSGNVRDVGKLNGMFMTIFLVIGFIALCCGMYLSNHLHMIFADGLTSSELRSARILMILLTVNLAISFPNSVFASIITANEQFIFQKTAMLIRQVASPLICIPLLLNGYASVGIVTATVVVSAIVDVANIYFCITKLGTKFEFWNFDVNIFREMFVYASFIAINMIVDQINLNIDKFLLGRYRGTVAVAVYSAGYTIYHYYTSFSTSISNVFIPRVHHIWNGSVTDDQKNGQLSTLFTNIGRIQFYILWLVSTGVLLFGRQFISSWAGKGYDNAYYVLLLLSFSAIVPLSQNVGVEIQRAKNKHQFRAILYLFMAIINLVLSIILCQRYGEVGCAIGTALSFLLANTICMNIYYYKVLKINILPYWKNLIKITLAALPACILGVLYCRYVNTYLLLPMLGGIIGYSVVYGFFEFFWTFSIIEKKAVVRKLKSILKRV